MSINPAEYGFTEISPDDYFQFFCSGCGDCCRKVKNSVMVETLDLYNIAKFLSIEMSDVITRYTDTVFVAPSFPIMMLKTKQHGDSCVFLKAARCSIQDGKPRTCRLYPLGVGPDDERPENWQTFIVSKKQHHFTGQRRRVRDWISENLTQADRDFMVADYKYTGELARLIKSIDNRHKDEIVRLVLYFKYIAYDMAADFMPQFTRNMDELKRQLKRLGERS